MPTEPEAAELKRCIEALGLTSANEIPVPTVDNWADRTAFTYNDLGSYKCQPVFIDYAVTNGV